MTTRPYKTMIRWAALAASAFAVTGAFAYSQGASEFDSLISDPLEAMFGDDEDVNTDELTIGEHNTAIIRQKGTAGNSVEVNQSGDGNLVISSQTSIGGLNMAEIVQSGNDNSSFIRQYGDHNEYELLQTGDNNISAAKQFGSRNVFEHVQTGNNLGIAVTQYGDSTVIVTQTGQ